MVEFREFKVEHIFDAIRSTNSVKNFSKSKIPTETENTPATSATVSNNMFGFYVDSSEHGLVDNCISVTANGDGFCCYQPKPFAIAQDSYALRNKFTENKYVYLYLVGALSKITHKYNYTNKSGWNRFKEDSISLPIQSQSDEEPDWEYMENYIKDIENKYIQQVTSEQEKEISLLREKVGNIGEINLSEVQFKEFRVGDLFDISRGLRTLRPSDRVAGNIPYINSSTESNGIAGYIGNPTIIKENCISIGLFGKPYYQEGSFTMANNTYALDNKKLSKLSGLYVCATIEILRNNHKFGYDNPITKKSLKPKMLTLPVKSLSDEEPNWDYMENYIAKIELEKRIQLLQFLKGDG